jgi:hypothetical protein
VGDKRKLYRVLVGKPEEENFETLGKGGGNKIKFDEDFIATHLVLIYICQFPVKLHN